MQDCEMKMRKFAADMVLDSEDIKKVVREYSSSIISEVTENM